MMECKLIITGLGGQGIVFVTRLLVQTAVALERRVLASETHGMSQRGGAVISHVRIDGSPAPLIRRGTADLLLALDSDEAARNLPFLRPGGTAVVNSDNGCRPEVAVHLERLQIEWLSLPANRLAADLGAPGVANVILAGYAAAQPALALPLDRLQAIVSQMSRQGTAVNREALALGYNYPSTVNRPQVTADSQHLAPD
jgi:indolepyruvate ferredoxin oxidoreductase, beta subunit